MKVTEVDSRVVEVISDAKARVAELTGLQLADVSVGLENSYGNRFLWLVNVFEADFQPIASGGDDLADVIEDIRKKHAEHLNEVGSNVARVKRLADKLGVKVEVLP